jgi:hypothetical protein
LDIHKSTPLSIAFVQTIPHVSNPNKPRSFCLSFEATWAREELLPFFWAREELRTHTFTPFHFQVPSAASATS